MAVAVLPYFSDTPQKKTNKPSSVRVSTNTQVYLGAFGTAHTNPISCYGYTAIDWHSSKRDETAVDRVNLIYKGSSQFPIRVNTENAMMCILLWHHSNLSQYFQALASCVTCNPQHHAFLQ